MGPFSAESGHLGLLAKSHDLIVYGSTNQLAGRPYQPKPPEGCRFRDFDPVSLSKKSAKGHLRWIYRDISSALDEDGPDVVHVISEPWGSLAIQAAGWARRNDFPGLVLHGCDQYWHSTRNPSDFKRWPRIALARRSLKVAGGFAGENPDAIQQARRGGLRESVPTGVIRTTPRDPSIFRPPTEAERREAREALGLPADGIGIGLLGRLVPEKGSTTFLEAWSLLRDVAKRHRAWAVIVGTGPLDMELRRMADDNTMIKGGLNYPDEVLRFFRAINVFVHPSWSTKSGAEQGARVLVEAMLSGCLAVVSDSGANRTMIGDSGLIVPERNPEELAIAVLEAIKRTAEGHPHVDARQRAIEGFSIEATAKKLDLLWHKVNDAT